MDNCPSCGSVCTKIANPTFASSTVMGEVDSLPHPTDQWAVTRLDYRPIGHKKGPGLGYGKRVLTPFYVQKYDPLTHVYFHLWSQRAVSAPGADDQVIA